MLTKKVHWLTLRILEPSSCRRELLAWLSTARALCFRFPLSQHPSLVSEEWKVSALKSCSINRKQQSDSWVEWTIKIQIVNSTLGMLIFLFSWSGRYKKLLGSWIYHVRWKLLIKHYIVGTFLDQQPLILAGEFAFISRSAQGTWIMQVVKKRRKLSRSSCSAFQGNRWPWSGKWKIVFLCFHLTFELHAFPCQLSHNKRQLPSLFKQSDHWETQLNTCLLLTLSLTFKLACKSKQI